MDIPILKRHPDIVIIEPTTLCANNCRDCPNGQGLVLAQHLEWSLFERLLDDIKADPPSVVRFAGYGEPPMWPHITDAIAGLQSIGVATIGLVTTGQSFMPRRLRDLFFAGLNELEFSMGSIDPERYHKDTGGARLGRADLTLREAIKCRPPVATINVSIIGRDDAAEASTYYGQMPGVDRVFVRQYAKLVDEQFVARCKGNRWPCPQLWRRLTLGVDGNWRYCCSDWTGQTSLGSGSLEWAWLSPAMEEHRKAHLEGRFSDVPACKNCGIWCMSRWDKQSYAANAGRR